MLVTETETAPKHKQKMKLPINFILIILFFQILAIPVSANELDIPPESSSGYSEKTAATGQKVMMVTANPIATQAGYDILELGGTAAEAAFAAQLVLGLVEPQSSGLGGGGFALYWDATEKKLHSYDGRETAPAAVTEDWFLHKDGTPMEFYEASIGGHAVGIPGTPKLLQTLYEIHGGKVTKDEIFSPAMELAEYGFIVSPRLAALIAENKKYFRYFKSAKDYFTPEGYGINLNQNITNDSYLTTLKLFKEEGSEIFYSGQIAKEIQETVNEAWHNPGVMSPEDFLSYEIKERPPVCGQYRTYKICSMGEPSSGGLTLIQSLQMLDRFDLESLSPNDPQVWHLITQAMRLSFADRNMYMADPDYEKTPGDKLIHPAYTAVRSSIISPQNTLEEITAGIPPAWDFRPQSVDKSKEASGTTHIVAIDQYGNAISMTSSIETAFGAKIITNGFLLNNQLTDFSFLSEDNGHKVANRAEGGKRPRSSMTPVIVFDQDNVPILLIGSAGGSRIIDYVLQRIISILDWKIPVQKALSMPNIITHGSIIEIEDGFNEHIEINAVREYGHDIKEVKELNSGLTAAYFINGVWQGAADPRREGIALGK
jgi:gamma-glutamyltranspeptidase / glutathione hydrolase